MRVYYLLSEYETGKHKILKVWSEKFIEQKPEESPKTAINVPYTVIEIDEAYNGLLCKNLLLNTVILPNGTFYDKYYVDNSGQIVSKDGIVQTINLNPYRESYKLSQFYGMTQAQLDAYIEANVTNLAAAREFLKKLSKVVLYLAKQTKLEG